MTHQSPFRIVVGYDFSPQAELALDRAMWLASGFRAAEVHVASALTRNTTNPDFPRVDKNADGAAAIRERLLAILEARAAVFKPESVSFFVHTWLEDGPTMILAIAADVGADMILVGTHSKRGFVRAVLGSVSEKIVREALCPVMVVRETTWARGEVPQIEPPCPRCVQARASSNGETWWCDLHDHAPPYQSPLRSHVQHDPEESRRMAWPMY